MQENVERMEEQVNQKLSACNISGKIKNCQHRWRNTTQRTKPFDPEISKEIK